ncbi:MAG: radical SAM protein [Desulfomonile tiedjei]|nr:radical SAM protein [Desulfomonile tiedjei]
MSFLFINVNHDVGYESSESIPISLGYILAALRADGWDGVILDDVRDRPLTLKSLEKWILRVDPMVIGFTAYQSTMNRIRFFCRYIKSRHRRIQIVLGGPQAAVMPSEGLEDLEDVDVLVRGEGEIVMKEIARALKSGKALDTVEGITCKCNGGIADTGFGPEPPEDLDAYASPYLLNLLNLAGKNTAILLSSRGCRHVCWFCITPKICRGKIRYHSVDRVVDEMELLTDQGIERIWFADPNFTDDRERTERLLRAKIDRGIATPFWFQTRSDLIDPSLMKKLKAAGADTIAFGLESGSPGVLEKTNKRIVLEQLRENISAAQSLGLETELFSVFGLPYETVDDARQTLEFVRSLGIPIQSNSGSQQMQLYFGSIYEKTPARFAINPLPAYRPRFLSVGDRYETDAMSRADLRKVRNMWALANEQLERDVYYKQRIFEVLDFLLQNREDLKDEPAFHAYGALAASAIEEFDLLVRFLEGYAALQSVENSDVEELISGLSFFKEVDEPAGPMDRVIFDSRSWIQGVPFTGISGKYWDVLLGRGLLLPSFESGFVGVRQGEDATFRFVFPDDYVQEELRGQEVEVQAKIHKVFKSVEARSVDEVKNLGMRNHYAFKDLELLREQNEILYYLSLRDSEPEALLKTPSHFLMLVHCLAKLGKQEQVRSLASMLNGKPAALNALADTVSAAGKCAWAAEYYEAISKELPSSLMKIVRCHLNLGESERAMKLLLTIPEGPSIEFQETLLECLKAAQSDSSRIPSLEHHVLNLRVTAALGREAVSRSSQLSGPPIVHGASENDS